MSPVKSVFGNDVTLHHSIIEHILKRHPEMEKFRDLEGSILLIVTSPDLVLAGRYGENIVAKKIEVGAFMDKWMLIPYEEGGVIRTAFIVSGIEKITKRRFVLWKR